MGKDYRNPIPTAGVLAFNQFLHPSELLMIRYEENSSHSNGLLGLPGGKQQIGESLANAAIREFKEETGLEAEVGDMLMTQFTCYETMNGSNYWMRLFFCKDYSGSIKKEVGSKTCPLWVPLKDLGKLNDEGKLEVNIYRAIGHGLGFAEALRNGS